MLDFSGIAARYFAKPDEYGQRLEQIVGRLQGIPHARPFSGNADINNTVAGTIMRRNDIPINDLYSAIKPTLAEHQLSGNCHFNAQGYKRMSQDLLMPAMRGLLNP